MPDLLAPFLDRLSIVELLEIEYLGHSLSFFGRSHLESEFLLLQVLAVDLVFDSLDLELVEEVDLFSDLLLADRVADSAEDTTVVVLAAPLPAALALGGVQVDDLRCQVLEHLVLDYCHLVLCLEE